ncbi:MAG: hypothetical protein M3Y32_08520, partial [Pseudomonadota bacterium]|nr:hypothetical protein [Pseudomonadota bacterium]
MDKPLNAATWSRLSALFDLAIEQAAPERARWLLQIERDEPALAPQLRDLLAADAERRTDDWLERGPSLHRTAVQDDED